MAIKMKKVICFLLCTVFLLPRFWATAAVEDGVVVKNGTMLNLDFQSEIPTALKSNGFSIENNSDFGVADNKVLRLNGQNAVIGCENVAGDAENCYFETDVKLTFSTGATSGVFSFALKAPENKTGMYIRFVYIDSAMMDFSTMRANGSTLIRDRLAIVYGSSDDRMTRWVYSKISESEIGVLDKDTHTTPWVKLKASIIGNELKFAMLDLAGNILTEISSTQEEIARTAAEGIVKEGGFRMSTNSCDILLDNIVYNRLSILNDVQLLAKQNVALVGDEVAYSLEGTGRGGERIQIDSSNAEFIYDSTLLSLNKERETMKFLKQGKAEVEAVLENYLTGEPLSAKVIVNVFEEYNFSKLRLDIAQECVFINSVVPYSIIGELTSGETIELKSGYSISGEAVVNYDAKTLQPTASGVFKLALVCGGQSGEAEIYVSKYEDIRLLTQGITVMDEDEAIAYAVEVKSNGMWYMLTPGEFCIKSDGNGLSIDKNEIKGIAAGEYKIYIKIDGIVKAFDFSVTEKPHGLMIYEDFENMDIINPKFMYNRNSVVADGENNVLKLENEITDMFGNSEWKDYEISMKAKIAVPVIEEGQLSSRFEIIPHRQKNEKEAVLGNNKGIPFTYRSGHNNELGSYMRISSIAGPSIDLSDGAWHDIKVVASGTQMIFDIDSARQVYNGQFEKTGYFSFLASNCIVYIDDVSVTKIKAAGANSPIGLSAMAATAIDGYAPHSLQELAAIYLEYGDGTCKYVTDMAQWSIASPQDGVAIVHGDTLILSKDKKYESISVKAQYQGWSCTFDIGVFYPAQSYREYIEKGVNQRKESLSYRILYEFNNAGINDDISGLRGLPHRYAETMLYPALKDYTAYIDWAIIQAEYEDKIIGRGNDGGDFVILQLFAWYNGIRDYINVDDAAWQRFKNYMLEYQYARPEDAMTENHKMIYYAIAILAGEAWENETFKHGGLTGKQLLAEYKPLYLEWVNHRIKRGFGEFNSPAYYPVDIFGFELLHSYAEDSVIKQAAYDMATMIYANSIENAIENGLTGPQMRTYPGHGRILKPLDLQFNLGTYAIDENYSPIHVQEAASIFSKYTPPPVLVDIALDTERFSENIVKNRYFVYTTVDDPALTESTRTYNYRTDTYSMGCEVYTENLEQYKQSNWALRAYTGTYSEPTTMIPGHQALPWTIQFAGGKHNVIHEGHPGKTGGHNYYYGDTECGCYKYFQEENVSVGMHKIRKPNEYEFTHFWIPRDVLEKVDEEDGWIFVKQENTFVAIRPLKSGTSAGTSPQYSWGGRTPTSEVVVEARDTAFVCEITDADKFGGTFEQFKVAIKANLNGNIQYSIADNNYFISYKGLNGKTVKLDYDANKRYIDGVEVNFDDYKLNDSKYIKSEWLSGKIEIKSPNNEYTITSYKLSADLSMVSRLYDELTALENDLLYEQQRGNVNNYVSLNGAKVNKILELAASYDVGYFSSILNNKLERCVEILTSE